MMRRSEMGRMASGFFVVRDFVSLDTVSAWTTLIRKKISTKKHTDGKQQIKGQP